MLKLTTPALARNSKTRPEIRRLIGPKVFAYRRGRRWLTANAFTVKRRRAA
jgi:hypothetical protein